MPVLANLDKMIFFVFTLTFCFLHFELNQAKDAKKLFNVSFNNYDNRTSVFDNNTNNENRKCQFGLIPGIFQMQQSVNLNKLDFFFNG